MMAYPKTHSFRGIKYRLYWRKPKARKSEIKTFKKQKLTLMGRTWPPGPGAKMYLRPDIEDPIEFLNTIVHEGVHACLWDLDEAAVTETVESIMALIVKMNPKIKWASK